MEKIKQLYLKYRELIVYVICGGLTTVVSFGTQFLAGLVLRGDNFTEVRTVISWICAVVFAFFVNKIFVFKDSSGKSFGRLFIEFVLMRVVSLGMETVIISLGVRVLHQPEMLYKLIGQVVVVISNYFFSKFYIFKKKSDGKTEE